MTEIRRLLENVSDAELDALRPTLHEYETEVGIPIGPLDVFGNKHIYPENGGRTLWLLFVTREIYRELYWRRAT